MLFVALMLGGCVVVADVGSPLAPGDDAGTTEVCEAGTCPPSSCDTAASCDGLCFNPGTVRERLLGGVEPVDLILYDGNGDGFEDVFVVYLFSAEVWFYAGNGQRGWLGSSVIDAGRSASGSAIADFTGDGILDVFLRQPETNRALFLVGTASGPSIGEPLTIASDSQQLLPHDVDSDGDLDLLVARADARCLDAHLNEGGGAFTAAVGACVPNADSVLWRFAGRGVDVNGDGRSEILGIPFSRGRLVAFDVDLETNTLVEAARWPIATTGIYPAVADVSGDDALEVVAMPVDGVSLFEVFRAQAGSTDPVCQQVRSPSGLAAVSVGDLDRDGLMDFLGFASAMSVVLARSSTWPGPIE